MVTQKIPNQRKVWQDIRPASPRPQPKLEPIQVVPNTKRKIKFPKISKRILLKVLAILITLTLLGSGLWYLFIYKKTSNDIAVVSQDQTKPSGINENPVLTKGEPEFTTLLPKGKSATDIGGWTRVSPNNSDPVYAYADTIDDTKITVSQQSLPISFKDDPAKQLEALANDFQATQKLQASNNLTAYIGISANGPQSVIFIKKDVLILIKSDKIIKNISWINYIDSFE